MSHFKIVKVLFNSYAPLSALEPWLGRGKGLGDRGAACFSGSSLVDPPTAGN